MNYDRVGHTASILKNGTVLITGGNNGADLNTAELYDPSRGVWTITGNIFILDLNTQQPY